MLLGSRKPIGQAKAVARLTLLALHFIPLSFTTSFFGMNIKELKGDELDLRVWILTSVPVFGAVVIMCFWEDTREWLKAGKKKIRSRKRN